MSLRFHVLGPLFVERDGSAVELASPTQRALLATLLVHANQPVSNDVLIEALWGDGAPERAEDTLRVHVSQLRKALGEGVVATAFRGYVLRLDPESLDSHRFEEDVRAAEDALHDKDNAAGERMLASALELWRSDAYDDLRYREVLQPEITRLNELRLRALELHAEAALRLGRHAELIPGLTELVGRYPHRERLWAQLMLALYRAARQSDALDAYRRARRLLRDELGLDPGPELQRLQQQILRQEPALDPETPEVRLPGTTTSFVGREQELAGALAMLRHARLVTLVGGGGRGKTRLAIETARRAAPAFAGGVQFADLSTANSKDALPGVVRSALGSARPAFDSELDALVLDLERGRRLLVLDNCEHVIDRAADLVSTLLGRCPELHILATSRERLAVPGETICRVPPMALEGQPGKPGKPGRADAEALFWARARDVAPDLARDVAPDGDTRQVVDEIVRALGGIPLAIELAAAQLGAMSLDRLGASVLSAMPDLGSGSRGRTLRHATLRAAFDWSLDLLGDAESRLFEHLWVFRGGWTVETLAALLHASETTVLAPLARLVEVSLVDIVRRGAETRYMLLEPVRQYARSRVASVRERDELCASHARVFVDMARRSPMRLGRADARILHTYEVEEANLTAALRWLIQRRAGEDVAALAGPLGQYWDHVGQVERAAEWFERALEATDGASPATLAEFLTQAAWNASNRSQQARADRLTAAALEQARASGDAGCEARALNELGNNHGTRGEMPLAARAFEASLAAAGRTDDRAYELAPLVNLAAIRTWMGDTDGGDRLALRVIALAAARGDENLRGIGCCLRGQAALYRGDLPAAERLLQEGVPLFAARGMRAIRALTVLWEGMAALSRNEVERAIACAEEARSLASKPPAWPVLLLAPQLVAWSRLAQADAEGAHDLALTVAQQSLEAGNLGGMASTLDLLAVLEHRLGASDRAALLLAAAAAGRRRLMLAPAPHESTAIGVLQKALAARVDGRRLAAIQGRGAALALDEAIEIALGGGRIVPAASAPQQAVRRLRPRARRLIVSPSAPRRPGRRAQPRRGRDETRPRES